MSTRSLIYVVVGLIAMLAAAAVIIFAHRSPPLCEDGHAVEKCIYLLPPPAGPPKTALQSVTRELETVGISTLEDPVALFTLVLAASTIALWWQTRRLANVAKNQSLEIAQSIEATKGIADATKEVAAASARQTQALIDIERPIVTLNAFQLYKNGPEKNLRLNFGQLEKSFYVQIALSNSGRTSAIVFEANVGYSVEATAPESTIISHAPASISFVVDPQADTDLVINLAERSITLSDEEYATVRQNAGSIWVFGYVTYRNFLDETWDLNFCWRWDTTPSAGGGLRIATGSTSAATKRADGDLRV